MSKKAIGVYHFWWCNSCIEGTHREYVGSGILRARINHHKCSMQNLKHTNRHVQSACNKYGIDNLVVELICICETTEDAREIEQAIFDYYIENDSWDSLYNINPSANGGATGCENHNAIFTSEEVGKVLWLLNSDYTAQSIADLFGCSRETIYRIGRKDIYTDIFNNVPAKELADKCETCTELRARLSVQKRKRQTKGTLDIETFGKIKYAIEIPYSNIQLVESYYGEPRKRIERLYKNGFFDSIRSSADIEFLLWLDEQPVKKSGLTPRDVRQIRYLLAFGFTGDSIGKVFEVSTGTVHALSRGFSFSNVAGETYSDIFDPRLVRSINLGAAELELLEQLFFANCSVCNTANILGRPVNSIRRYYKILTANECRRSSG